MCGAPASTTSKTSTSPFPGTSSWSSRASRAPAKSSLAFDTIYAEGQRRYVESLSAYARQFLGRMDKPDVDYIEGLSPAISIDQKGVSHNPRSTVGTVTEVYDYLRLLFARVGDPHCYKCGRPVERQTVQQIVDAILSLDEGARIQIMAPMVRRRKGEHKDVFDAARTAGYVRVRVNGEVHDLSEQFDLDKKKWHTIEVVVDRLVVGDSAEPTRVADSVESALKMAGGVVLVSVEGGDELLFSEQFACVHCNISLGELEPRTFSFNNPHGACPECTGLGYKLEVDPDFVIPNREMTLGEGAVQPWGAGGLFQSVVREPPRFAIQDVRLLDESPGKRPGRKAPGPDPLRQQGWADQDEPCDSTWQDLRMGHYLRGCS